jgi:hypothetical protein
MGIGLLQGLGDSLVGVKHRLLTVGLRLGAVYPLSRRLKLDGALRRDACEP